MKNNDEEFFRIHDKCQTTDPSNTGKTNLIVKIKTQEITRQAEKKETLHARGKKRHYMHGEKKEKKIKEKKDKNSGFLFRNYAS